MSKARGPNILQNSTFFSKLVCLYLDKSTQMGLLFFVVGKYASLLLHYVVDCGRHRRAEVLAFQANPALGCTAELESSYQLT